MNETFVGEHMVKFPYTVGPKLTVREAFYLMEEWRVRHLPVVEDGKVTGIVSERDLRQYFNTEGEMPLCEVMTEAPHCVRIGTSLADVLTIMEKKKIGSVIVVTVNNNILGIFTTTDAIRLLRRMLKEDPESQFSKWSVEDAFEAWDEADV